MTDENTQGASQASDTAASSDQHIPKQRLDEVIAERNHLRQQTQFMTQTLNQLMQQQRPAPRPQEETSEMRELRENNPLMYRKFKEQERSMMQIRAAQAAQIDNQDRILFIQEFGDAGKKDLQEVEQLIERERASGNFKVNRAGAYLWLKGQRSLQQQTQAPAAPAPQAPAAPSAVKTAPTEDIPPTQPSAARFVNGDRAPVGYTEAATPQSREEYVKRLRDQLKDQKF